MKIVIIGYGFVGKTVHAAFNIAYKRKKILIIPIDKKNKNELNLHLDSNFIFICLPTDLKKNKLDTSLIKNYLNFLNKSKYKGVIIIKSTLNVGDTDSFINKYKNLSNKIVFVPEFLRERLALKDFLSKNQIIPIGTNSKHYFKKIKSLHTVFTKNIIFMKPKEAELLKLFSNSYNANRIVFANAFYEVCKSAGSNYNKILQTYLLRKNSSGNYLNCNEDLRGYGGKCLPKDIASINFTARIKTNIKFFKNIIDENKKFKTTIIK